MERADEEVTCLELKTDPLSTKFGSDTIVLALDFVLAFEVGLSTYTQIHLKREDTTTEGGTPSQADHKSTDESRRVRTEGKSEHLTVQYISISIQSRSS